MRSYPGKCIDGVFPRTSGRPVRAKLQEVAQIADSQARAYTLADNKLTDRSRWDDVKVAETLRDLSEFALDFEAIGFEQVEVPADWTQQLDRL